MDKNEGKRRAEAFYKQNLPFGVARYIGCRWRSSNHAQAEFCFERVRKGKREYVCIVLYEKQLTGSEEDLDRALEATLGSSDYRPCERDYGYAGGGHDSKGPRPWKRDN